MKLSSTIALILFSLGGSAQAFTCYQQVDSGGTKAISQFIIYLSNHSSNTQVKLLDGFAKKAPTGEAISTAAGCKIEATRLHCYADYNGGEFELTWGSHDTLARAPQLTLTLLTPHLNFADSRANAFLLTNDASNRQYTLKKLSDSFCNQ